MNMRIKRQMLSSLFLLLCTALVNQGQSFGIGVSPIAGGGHVMGLALMQQQNAVLASHPELTMPRAEPVSITGTRG